MEERVLDLDKQIFCINGHFDHENIYKDAIVPLQNEDGNHFYGKVLDITEDTVKMDLNHPYAGKDLQYEGTIVMSREATKEEIQAMVNRLSGEGCCCGGNCGGHGGCGEDGCGCGGDDHNHDECGCGCHCH
ncbi:MAG: peptidylprolyl isomerase, partial [Prevotella sp.]|nr:peptidylprolyl isomerase [Prevotella sp.]